MRVLGIDTATSQASAGLWADGSVIAEKHTSSRNHAASLLPLIDAVLSAADCNVDAIDVLAVSAGPGSFSGLRVGLSVAKGFALASGLSLVAVPTLDALAATVAGRHGFICPLLDAHKGELYLASFASESGQLRRLSEDAALTVEAAIASMPRPCVVVGDAVERYADVLTAALGSTATLLPFPEYGPRGGTGAAWAAEHFAERGAASPAGLEPFYIRIPEIQVSN